MPSGYMDRPLVSVLLPVYNTSSFLTRCLDSVLGQTYPNLQIVLVDDGSTDNSLAVCQKYAYEDPRIEVYHQENQGVAATRNVLLSKIKGDYFLFVDSDDWMETDMVDFLLGRSIETDAGIVTCMVVNDDTGSTDSYSVKTLGRTEAVKEFLRHIDFNGSLWNKLIKTELLPIGLVFRQDISYGEDALFCWELLQGVGTVTMTDRQLYHYRMNDDSLSHSCWSPEKKGSGHIVWDTICRETVKSWPQYRNIAEATYAISDMWQLYYALESGYPYDDNIKSFQNHVKEKLPLIFKSGLIGFNKFLFACVVSHSYSLGRAIIRLL